MKPKALLYPTKFKPKKAIHTPDPSRDKDPRLLRVLVEHLVSTAALN